MRLRPRLGARSLWPALLLLAVACVRADQLPPKERHYFIAAVEIDWNYSGNDIHSGGPTYKKVVFREYDRGFQQAKAHPSWLGLLGPTLRAEEGETIVVTFRNMATGPHSIHPHGVAYGKQSEGAHYFDNTSQKEKEDDVVRPNGEHTYYWEASPKVSPQPNDPTCLTYTYISHEQFVEDFNSGLIGALLICKPGSLDESGNQVGVHHEYVFLFGVFDENQSKYKQSSSMSDNMKYTINGYARGSLPDVSICAHSPVSLHLLGMSSRPEVFSVHINGQVFQQSGHKVSSVGLISGSSATVSMVALHTGRWLISSHTIKHMEAGMHGFVDVRKCSGFEPPRRHLTLEQRRQSTEWTYYIAAEEIIWDYAPNKHEHIDEEFESQFLKQSATRVGSKYKKAVYTLYKNASFTEKVEPKQRKSERGILGPVIRAQIRDVIRIVFKNKASRPYSIYPHGLTIEKAQEGANYPAGSNQSHGVPPGETHTYVWKVVDEDQPLDKDSRCLTRIYHSAVNTPRDIASGLIGPILICKKESLDLRNAQVRADKEQHAALSVFDENKSWYLDDNIRQFCDRSQVHKSDPDFYKSNVMHTINGYVYETGPLLGFCNGEVATWHVSSIGAQDYIQTLTFYGHTFTLNERTEDFLSLYPMTGESITVSMMNIGVWLLTSLYSHEAAKGMRVKFQDVECFREYEYDYDESGSLWNPLSLGDLKKAEEKPKPKPEQPALTDDYTDEWAATLGLRTLKNQSKGSVEEIDLSQFDYDAVNVDTGISPSPTAELNKNNTFLLNLSSQNETLVAAEEVETLNHAATLQNTSSTENTTHTWNSSAALTFANSSVHDTANTTVSGNSSSDIVNVPAHNTTEMLVAANSTTRVSSDHSKEAEVDTTVEEDSVEQVTRGDVFLYLTPSSNESAVTFQSVSESSVPPFSKNGNKEENKTKVVVVKRQVGNSTSSQLETLSSLDNTNSPISAADVDYSLNVTNSSLENVTDVQVESANVTGNSGENVTALLAQGQDTSVAKGLPDENPVPVVGSVISLSGEMMSSSQELGTSDSEEEVVIYLKGNKSNPIKTTSVKVQEHNWTYEGTHQTETMEVPDYLLKYLGKETPQLVTNPKRTRKINLRHWPEKGHGMKTKRRKEYKPQPGSGIPFSPRGFHPGMTPRGSRPTQPISDEAELLNRPIVIGVPRPDFSDYDLYVPSDDLQHLAPDDQNGKADEYEYVSYKDPYSSHEDVKNFHLDENTQYFLKNSGQNAQVYFIAAEEVAWDYAGYGQRRQEKTQMNSQDTKFTKVVFRRYMDSSFSIPEVRGEIDEHLGILGPVIKAEVGQSIVVVFKNTARRPYSIHPNGVSYTKQTEGLSYEDGSKYWFKYDNEVKPGTSFTYIWTVPAEVGPKPEESQCRTWVYYSGVNPERDIHSGLIGPLLVCRNGTLAKKLTDWREFTLLFMTFDETKSWYHEKNHEMVQRKSRRRMMGPEFRKKLMFHSINGIIYNLKGLRMYTNQLVYWHLINMGSPRDYQSVHFHGQTFLHMNTHSFRQSVFPLLPGSFATLEMYPSKPGLWLLETEVGLSQQMGMQTLLLVLDDDCGRPLGLESGSVKDNQITANSTRGYWEPRLARLNNQGKYNAWSTDAASSYIQVDFQRPVVISQVATQGARQMFQSQFVTKYFISYSTDRRKWIFYKGDSVDLRKEFNGSQEAYETVKNTLFPPVIGRFVRLHPVQWYNKATVRMEFYGCELDGCSVPLGLESREIEDRRITASSTASSWYSGRWQPHLARLNLQGTINAWQAKYNDMNQWLQVELPHTKKITGIITQGAKALGTEMYVISYSLQYSHDGVNWKHYTDDDELERKTFLGNTNNNDHVKNYIYPPIFARFIRIVPRSWMNTITMRAELLGCEFE